jgi:methionyl aminopeptidase
MTISSEPDLAGMRAVGRLVAETLRVMRAEVRPGITTGELDAIAERHAKRAGARSAPQLAYDFPGFTCISVNDEIVHGIPGPRALMPGDVVKLDVTLELGGYIADSAITVLVPPTSPRVELLQRCARTALNQGIDAARAGSPVREIGRAVEREARRSGFAAIRELTGHGVGLKIHEPPEVPNFADPAAKLVLTEGLVLAVEPMLSAVPTRVIQSTDGWTLRTQGSVIAVHREHTIVVRRGRAEVLTAA